MSRFAWYEKVVLGLGAVALVVSIVEFARSDGDGIPYAFITAGLLLAVGASALARRHGELPSVSWYEIVFVCLAGAALVVSIVQFARVGGAAATPFTLAAISFALLAIMSRLVRPPRMPAE